MKLVRPQQLRPGMRVKAVCGFPCRRWLPCPRSDGTLKPQLKLSHCVPRWVLDHSAKRELIGEKMITLLIHQVSLPYITARCRDKPPHPPFYIWLDTREVNLFPVKEK